MHRIKCARYLLCSSDYTFVQLIRWVVQYSSFHICFKKRPIRCYFCFMYMYFIKLCILWKESEINVHLVGCNCRSPFAGQIHPCTNCSKWNSLPAAFVSLSFAYFRMDFSDTLGTGIKISKIIKKIYINYCLVRKVSNRFKYYEFI